ncbi:MAG: TetR/AcrR family transcriptional regulator [Breznakibacter sp.]
MNDTKEFIIDEAFKLFLNHSYEAVSISDISKAIGLTKGALYHHFKNKEELFISVIDKYIQIFSLEDILDSLRLEDFIKLLIGQTVKNMRSVFQHSNTVSPIDYLSLIADAFRHYPGFAETQGNFINSEMEKTVQVFKNAIKSGEIRDDIDPFLAANNLYAINMGIAGNVMRNISIEDAVELLKRQTSEFYSLLKK